MPRYSKSDQAEARERLTEYLPAGSTLYAIIRSVSRSGMSRQISFYALRDNEPVYLSSSVAKLLGWPMKHGYNDSVRVDGCGMDMAFHTTYCVSQMLHNDGYAIKSSVI